MNKDQRRALAYGLVVVGAFLALDLAAGDNAPISGSFALGAIVAGVLGGFVPALPASAVALVLSLLSGAWNDDFGSKGYFARLFVCFAGTLLALGAGRLRDDNYEQLERQRLLGAVAELPRPGETLEQTLERVADLLVPHHARYAAVEGGLGAESAQLVARGAMSDAGGAATETRLIARGRDIGSLTLAGGRAGSQSEEFLRILSGRVALALDNAGLSQELSSVEQQLQAILENLGEAVTVQDRSGRLVFANRAAAKLLGAESVDDLISTPPMELMERFSSVHEDGRPIAPDDLPGRAVLAGGEAKPLTLRSRDRHTGEEFWRVTKSTAVRGPDGDVVLAVNVIEDVTETKRAEFTQRLLSEASSALASSLDYRQTLQRVAQLVVPSLADGCSMSIPVGDELEQVAGTQGQMAVGEVAEQVLSSGRPLLLAEMSDEPHSAALVVPMATPERVVGVLSLVSTDSERRFSDADVDLALELGRRAATAIENARLYSQLDDIATTLQRSLLPPELPQVPGWRTHALYMPAGEQIEVGGDFYDIFPTAAGWMAVMGDVVGRGPAAASLTAMGRYTLRTAGSLVGTPTMGLARLNENLRDRGDMALCTAAVVLLRETGDEASLVLAGHPQPFLVRAGAATPVGRTGPLLGAFEQGHWLPASIPIERGDVLVLFTDGVLDARGPDGRFGEERLAQALHGATGSQDAVERIQRALFEFAGDEQDDDTAVLALEKL